jgi:hypothetical protein
MDSSEGKSPCIEKLLQKLVVLKPDAPVFAGLALLFAKLPPSAGRQAGTFTGVRKIPPGNSFYESQRINAGRA